MHQAYSAATITGIKNVALASMDALQNYFFWTWKIGNSTQLGTSSCPMWHYKLGMQQGWIPRGKFMVLFQIITPPISFRIVDPREATGFCTSLLQSSQPFDGIYPSTATGGVSYISIYSLYGFLYTIVQAGAGTLDPVLSASHTFPPETIYPSFSGASLPTYTPTGPLKTLPAPTFTSAPTASVGSGWNNPGDNLPAYV